MKKATLNIDGKEISLDILTSTFGDELIDIQKLYTDHGYLTYDPGFMSTAACKSAITYIDGEKGILKHRGYNIASLENKDFLEVAYLLLRGELPSENQFKLFQNNVQEHSLIHEQLHFLFRGFPRAAHPMSVMVATMSALSAFYHDSLDIHCEVQRELAIYRVIAKVATLAAMTFRYSIGRPFVHPLKKYNYSENLLYMMFSNPLEEYKINPIFANALNTLLILHIDHEQNASTSTVRVAGSSGANPFACIGAGIASLWGPLHGGANEAVLKMLQEIGKVENIPSFIDKVKSKEIKLMGFGHRVYKNYDPRATILRKVCKDVLSQLGDTQNPNIEIAMKLEEIALHDDYFIERKLYPNVDFYSGIIYKALGMPSQMLTVMFAVARTAGWISQWDEMIKDPTTKIARPRQLYLGDNHE